jgi:hypothetical protein
MGLFIQPNWPLLNRCLARFYPGVDMRELAGGDKAQARAGGSCHGADSSP